MKKFLILSVGIVLMVPGISNVWAEQPASNTSTYIATMSGVTSGGSKKEVHSAFRILDGFVSIKITSGNHAGTQLVTIISTSATLTKEEAINALGSKASRYIVYKWKRIAPVSHTEKDHPSSKSSQKISLIAEFSAAIAARL